MLRTSGSYAIPIAIFRAILVIVLPVSAYNVSIYDNSTGFNSDLHKDSVGYCPIDRIHRFRA
jgi:hypothetical protein